MKNSKFSTAPLVAGGCKRRGTTSLLGMALAGLLLAGPHSALAADSVKIVDRGLPTVNLNENAGVSRANVSWAEPDLQYFDGDDFTVPALQSGFWRIDTIRTWFVGYNANNNADLRDDTFLGDFYKTLSLYVGPVGGTLSRVALADFVAGSDSTANPSVVATRVQYNGGVGAELDYQSGSHWTIVQLDFNNLNLSFTGGTQVQFGVHTDQGVAGGDFVFSHASNAALSGAPQDQADGLLRVFQLNKHLNTATLSSTWDSSTIGWDKSSDINVQVFATAVHDKGGHGPK